MQSIRSTGTSKVERAVGHIVGGGPPFQATAPPQPFPSDSAHKLAFTIKEAARASGLSRSLLYVAIGRGALRAKKCGARTLILDSDLRRFLRGLPRLAAGEPPGAREPECRPGRNVKRPDRPRAAP